MLIKHCLNALAEILLRCNRVLSGPLDFDCSHMISLPSLITAKTLLMIAFILDFKTMTGNPFLSRLILPYIHFLRRFSGSSPLPLKIRQNSSGPVRAPRYPDTPLDNIFFAHGLMVIWRKWPFMDWIICDK